MIENDFIKDYEILLRRLTIIALSLESSTQINTSSIKSKLEELYGYETKYDVDTKTISRDIDYIEKNFGLSFELANTRDYRFKNLTDSDKLSQAIKLFLLLVMKSSEMENSIHLLAENENKQILLNLMYINAAIRNRQTIKITYKLKHVQAKSYTIDVQPYEVAFNFGRWYLIGYSIYSEEYRQYILSNIEKVEWIKKNDDYVFFERDKNFSMDIFYSASIKSFRSEEEKTEFHVWFSKDVLQDIELLYRLAELKIEKQNDGSIIAIFKVDGDTELIDWIWQFGDKAKILSPKSAIDNLKERMKRIRKLY